MLEFLSPVLNSGEAEILKLDESCISNSKLEILRMDSLACGVWAVHSEISSFEFEMQDSSNFKISALPSSFEWNRAETFARRTRYLPRRPTIGTRRSGGFIHPHTCALAPRTDNAAGTFTCNAWVCHLSKIAKAGHEFTTRPKNPLNSALRNRLK